MYTIMHSVRKYHATSSNIHNTPDESATVTGTQDGRMYPQWNLHTLAKASGEVLFRRSPVQVGSAVPFHFFARAVGRRRSKSSMVFGQSSFSRRDRDLSANTFPPVWQPGQ
jgi:hypothetical protein